MSEKQNDTPKASAKEDERSLDDIEKELDELRPKPPSPKTQHRIEEEEKKKDREVNEHKSSPSPAAPIEVKNNEQKHGEHELTPGKPDPTVNQNVKIPVLNERGDIELKPQQGSALNK